ncbi:protein ECERIFERUM 26-like [Senna tora]|uniref:Protein ECERIFERUM 26-like n=1 Tax=Senna tora TaxID=362788 RepID=A0A834X292_9FABA|nr:protein ECERIFERUM 26-like [Senna tora]
MVFPQEESLVYDVRLSSVGPARSTGTDVFHNPSGLDLAMKLHYLRVVYFFESEGAQGLSVMKIKETMFTWFNHYFIACGRFRRSETSGRPYIKCNDCGARFIEAKCNKSLDEWLEMKDWPLHKLLVSHQVIGPELQFSPPVLFQVTYFKCGGVSLGLSWAHVLGDPVCASEFINSWGRAMSGLGLNKPINIPRPTPPTTNGSGKDPVSAKRADPVGDHWIPANNCKMDTFSFHLTSAQMNYLQAQMWGPSIEQSPPFESLCAVIWRCIAEARAGSGSGSEPKIVTVCKKDNNKNSSDEMLGNKQVISKVEAESSIIETDLRRLARMLGEEGVDERKEIEEAVNKEEGGSDMYVYGANLTFVDLEEGDVYGLEVKGHKPKFVYYSIQGVGDEGAVLVLPCPKPNSIKSNNGSEGRFVTIILPEDQMGTVISHLKNNALLL